MIIVIIGVIDILIYWNIHLYNKAQKIEDNEKKIKILAKKVKFPKNDFVYYQLGRAYFDLGLNNLSNRNQASELLQRSIINLSQSLKVNPAFYFAHFDLAQSKLYMSYLSPSYPSSHDEFKKAAILAGDNSLIFFEVAKIFLARWPRLSDEDKYFTLNIVKKIVSKKDKEKFRTLLYLWAMNIKDYNVIEKALPEDPQIYRNFAQFLGEKSLSLEVRQKYLAKAEFLEFEKAKEEFDSGEHEFFYFRMQEASNHFKNCLNILHRLRFYHLLAQKSPIDHTEFNELQKSALLYLAKCQIEQGSKFKDIEGYLRNYLALEDKLSALNSLESYLKNRDFIGEKLEGSFSDLDRLYFELLLYARQGRYREIVRVGRLLEKSYIVIPAGKKKTYIQILNILGDAYKKVDYIYDAGEFYQKALNVDSNSLESLVRIRQNLARMNADEKVREINGRIQKILSPKKIDFRGFLLKKGRTSSQTLIFDGGKKFIEVSFNHKDKRIFPLITLFFNERLVWENYLKDKVISIPVESKVGENLLQIKAVNRSARIVNIRWSEEGKVKSKK